MQEYTLEFKEGLIKGLRSSDHNPMNNGFLLQADGVIKEFGELFNIEELTQLDISDLDAQTFPFPQLIQLRNWTLLCTPTKIYTYDGSSFTLVFTTEDEGSTWTYADFYRYLLMTNGKVLITLDPETGAWSKYVDCLIPHCLCLCDVNGQVFCGGPECEISAGWLGE